MVTTHRRPSVSDLFRHIVLSWLIAAAVEYFLLPGGLQALSGLDGLGQMSFVRVLAVTAGLSLVLTLLPAGDSFAAAERCIMAGVLAGLSAVSVFRSFLPGFGTVCLMLWAGGMVYAVRGWDDSPEPLQEAGSSRKQFVWATVVLTAVFFLFVSVWTVGRVMTFSTPSYDFGIFSQMFYSMKESGLPMTTLERDGLLSHFRVHVSPIYYLMLPFYMLIPRPETLQILQAAVIASSVIPLWKIGRQYGLPDWQRMVLCVLLLLFPAFSGGTSYDLHENCFLTPLILWLFYGIGRESRPLTMTAGVLTLMVKEDAAVYVAVIALWLMVRSLLREPKGQRRSLVTGGILLAVSLVWFMAVTTYLANVGDGVMTYRYDNFIYDGSGSLFTVIKAVLMNPMKAVYECVEPEKLRYILLTMLPLLGLPLLTRRYERYILLIPYILVNLMSDYVYQHDVFFQYGFGSLACLMYLTAANLADIRKEKLRFWALMAATVISIGCFAGEILPAAVVYPEQAVRYSDHYETIRRTLAQIPEDAAVAASTHYTTVLSQRKILYDTKYCSTEHLLECEYVVLADNQEGGERLHQILGEAGYGIWEAVPNVLTIYKKEV